MVFELSTALYRSDLKQEIFKTHTHTHKFISTISAWHNTSDVFTLLLFQLFLVSYYLWTLSVQSKHNDDFCCSWQMVCLDCQIFFQVLWLCRISYADIINTKILHFLYLLHKQQDIIFVVLISNMVRHCFLSISCKWWDILIPTLVLWQVHDG